METFLLVHKSHEICYRLKHFLYHLHIFQACPMNMHPQADPKKTPQEIWEDFSLNFTPAVREVVEFAKHIPGFSSLSQNDQITLLKAGTFEVSSKPSGDLNN